MIEARKDFFVGYPAFAVGEFFCFADVGSESFNMGQIGVENFADKRIELAMLEPARSASRCSRTEDM